MNKGFLTLSLILNVGLLGTVGYLVANRSTPPPAAVETAPVETVKTNVETRLQTSPKRVVTVTNEVAQKFGWESVESADYREYIKNLRSIGCPEETIRDIIIADVNKLFDARKKASGVGKKFEFWKTGNMFSGMIDEEAVKKKQELAAEKKALLKELLGIEPADTADITAMNPFSGMLDFLSDEKQAKVTDMMQNFQSKAMKSMQGGAPDAQDMKEMQKVQKEFEEELAKILSPEELEDYNLRLSQTAMMMRMQLGTFEPTEQEFRDLFKLKKAFDDEYGLMGMTAGTKEEKEKMKAAQKELDKEIEEMLGGRYSAYQRSQDWNYQGIVKVTERNGLSRDVADSVFDTNKRFKEQQKAIREDKTLSKENRDRILEASKEENQLVIKNLLGEKAYEAYTNRPGFSR